MIDIAAHEHRTHECDLCVVGGGLAGMAAAVCAARGGAKVVLMQDRPVLGGNASSEIRMWVRGAAGRHNRETGIVSELEEENLYRNPRLNFSLWDSVLYGLVTAEKNVTLLLNCSCLDAETDGDTIVSVTGWQLTTYTFHTVRAKLFADCSGDSVLAPLSGALYRVGREGNAEYGERIGPAKADAKTMGMSCLIQARETDAPVKFVPPEWAYRYERDEDFAPAPRGRDFTFYGRAETVTGKAYTNGRQHNNLTTGNFWWIELGGDRDSLHDAEAVRDELLRVALGIWDHVKNHGDHGAENWALDWIGFLPGKRESRRYVGDHVLTQNDVESGGHFDDVVAYGGWTLDDHNPAGFYSGADEPSSVQYPAPSPYGIPYRCLYSKNVRNLFFAGRNVSATHAANSSTRVMATCSLLGQAAGTAAALCVRYGLTPRGLYEAGRVPELQADLREQGCYIPFSVREIPALTRSAACSLSAEDRAVLADGKERPDADGTDHAVTLPAGGEIVFTLPAPARVETLRLRFDPDFSRETVSDNVKVRAFAMLSSIPRSFTEAHVPATLVRAFDVYADGERIHTAEDSHHALVTVPVARTLTTLRVVFRSTWGADKVRVYSCDFR